MTTTETTAGGALAIRDDQNQWTPQQLAALGGLGINESVGQSDLDLFLHQAQRTGLDPFAKQIYMVSRYDGRTKKQRWTIQTAIDGYRLIADRTGCYVGSTETWAENGDGLVSATVTVDKMVAGVRCSFSATAHWNEYVQTSRDGKPMLMWARMPHRMLAKCAEALALRKAFPQDLSGMYTAEEMAQDEVEPAEPRRKHATFRDGVRAALADINDATAIYMREWWKQQDIPPLDRDRFTVDHAEMVMAKLKELSESDGSAPTPPHGTVDASDPSDSDTGTAT